MGQCGLELNGMIGARVLSCYVKSRAFEEHSDKADCMKCPHIKILFSVFIKLLLKELNSVVGYENVLAMYGTMK